MNESENKIWEAVREKSKDFYRYNGELQILLKPLFYRYKEVIISDFRQQLQSGNVNEILWSLNILHYSNEDIKMALFEDIINLVTSASIAVVGVAQNVLHTMSLSYVKNNSYDLILKLRKRELNASFVDEDIYQYICSFFVQFDMTKQLRQFLVDYCLNRNNETLDCIYLEYIDRKCFDGRYPR